MTAHIYINLNVGWEGEDVHRYGECMEMLRVGVEDEVRAFLEGEDYTEATIISCEATG